MQGAVSAKNGFSVMKRLKQLLLIYMFIMASAENQEKVVVIGAGFAGLTAAYRLQAQGIDVEVYEARERVGGRVFSVNILGSIAELGGQNIRDGGRAENLLTLASELNLKTQSKRLSFKPSYVDGHELYDFKKLVQACHFTEEQVREMLYVKGQEARNMEELLSLLFMRDEVLYKACKVLLEGYEGGSLNRLSAQCRTTLYHILLGGLCAVHSTSDEIESLSIAGGNGLLAEKLAHLLGNRVHLNHPLTAMDKEDRNYRLTFKGGKTVAADRVILTMPCPIYKDLVISDAVMAQEKKDAISALPCGTTAKIIIPVESVTSRGYLSDAMTLFNAANSTTLTLYFRNAHASFTQDTLCQKLQMALPLVKTFYTLQNSLPPHLAQDTSFVTYEGAVGHSWPLDPFAQGSYSYIPAGQEEAYTSMTQVEGEKVKTLFAPIDNTLFFAGEHTCIDLEICGTMEAAVESGERIARLLLKCMTHEMHHQLTRAE